MIERLCHVSDTTLLVGVWAALALTVGLLSLQLYARRNS